MNNPEIAARDIHSVARLIRENIAHETEKYSFLEVIVVERFDRNKKNCLEIEFPGIQKSHHFTLTMDGRILSRHHSCEACIEQGGVCEVCNEDARLVYQPSVALDEEPEERQAVIHEGEEGEFAEDLDDDEGLEDFNDDDSCLDPEEDERAAEELGGDHGDHGDGGDGALGPGDIVWVRRRKWIPGTVIDLHDVPHATRRFVPEYPPDQFIVQLFPPYNDVVVVPKDRIVELGENRQDRKFASADADVHEAYTQAVSALNGDG